MDKLLILLLMLISCVSFAEGVKDDSLGDALTREVMCTVAAERFHVYEEAKKHYEHALELLKTSIRHNKNLYGDTNIYDGFKFSFIFTRDLMLKKTKDYSASFLMEMCDFKIKNSQFNQAG